MALHGEIKVNHHIIGDWSAQRAGTTGEPGEFIYRCRANFTDMAGYSHTRSFFVRHMFLDGAIALTAKIMLECDERMEEPALSERTAWHDFAAKHNLNPHADHLADYIDLED